MSDSLKHAHVCIMAGGAGTRFWPLSTEEKPKQFIDVLGVGKTMLQMTFERALSLVPANRIWVMTHEKYEDITKEQLPELPNENILLEPLRKNTAPAIAFAAAHLLKRDSEAVMVLLSSDHLILKEHEFLQDINIGIEFVTKNNAIFTLGIQPTEPHTGYGYIHFDRSDTQIKNVRSFVEKPTIEIAQKYLLSGEHLWNAGIFIWKAQRIWDELRKHCAQIFTLFEHYSKYISSDEERDKRHDAFLNTPSDSIDYAIMEKVSGIFTKPSDIGWSDVGTWGALYQLLEMKTGNNVLIPDVDHLVVEEVYDSLIRLPHGMRAIIKGLNGYIVTLEEGGLLIYPIGEEQSIKSSLQKLK